LFDDFSHERVADCESGFALLGGAEVEGEVADRQLLSDFDGFVGPVLGFILACLGGGERVPIGLLKP
jgi:hypothetical protein